MTISLIDSFLTPFRARRRRSSAPPRVGRGLLIRISRPCGTCAIRYLGPGVQTPGYSRKVPAGLVQYGILVPALKRRAILIKSLRDLFCAGMVPGVETPGYGRESLRDLSRADSVPWRCSAAPKSILRRSRRDSMRIARRFSAGPLESACASPAGTAESSAGLRVRAKTNSDFSRRRVRKIRVREIIHPAPPVRSEARHFHFSAPIFLTSPSF